MTWWAVGTAVVGAAGSYLSAKKAAKAGKPTNTETQLQQLQLENLRKTSPMALDYLGRAGTNLSTANDFYGNLYRGGRAGALSLLAPDLQAADKQRAASLGSAARLMPRGGGSAEGRLASMDSAYSDRNNALLSLRPKAADMLAGIGSQFGNLGTSLASGSASSGLGLMGALQNQRSMQFDQQRAAGQSLYQLMQSLGGAFGSYGANRGTSGGSIPISNDFSTMYKQSNPYGVMSPGGTG